MSDPYTSARPYATDKFYSPQGAAVEMQSILDRAKDERLRLLRLLKDCETRFGTTGVVPPAEEIARLTGKVRAIDDAVRNRYRQLRHDEVTLEKRAHQIDQLREGVQELTQQFNAKIDQARAFKPELAAVKQTVKTAIDLLIQDVRGQLDRLGSDASDQLGEFRDAQTNAHDQLRQAHDEVEKTFADIDNRIADVAGRARDEAQKLIDPIFGQLENQATDCGDRVRLTIEAADQTMREKLEALPAQAVQTLAPTKATLEGVIEDARTHTASLNHAIQSLDVRMRDLPGQVDGMIQEQLDALPDRARQALDEQLNERLEAHRTSLDSKLEEVFSQKQKELIRVLDERAQALADQLIAQQQKRIEQAAQVLVTQRKTLEEGIAKAAGKLSELWDRKSRDVDVQVNRLANERVSALSNRMASELKTADDRAESIAQEIHGRLTASLDQSYAEAINTADRIESKAAEVVAKADEQGEQIAQSIERSLCEQVVAAMGRADAIADPFKARLEESLNVHLKLTDELAQAAETELTDKAKQHLQAFRKDTEAVLDEQKNLLQTQADITVEDARQKMKQRVQDLCASSKGMVELIEKQLTRRLKAIEPQTHQAVESIEQQIRQRLGQFSDNARSMVQLVEDQLSKRVAALQPQAQAAAREAERELQEHLARVRQEVDNVVAPLRRQIIEELGQIADVGKSVRRTIKRDESQPDASQDAAIDPPAVSPPVVDPRKLATPLQELANRMGKKAARLVDARDDAEKTAKQAENTDTFDTDPDTQRKAA